MRDRVAIWIIIVMAVALMLVLVLVIMLISRGRLAVAVSSYDLVTVGSDYITADTILWRRYRNRAPLMLERMLDDNPHLAKCHRTSPFLPVGTQIRIPIDFDILSGMPQVKSSVVLWGTTPEGNLTQGT